MAKVGAMAMGSLPKHKVYLGSSLDLEPKGLSKFHSGNYREGALPSSLPMDMVLTKESPEVGVVSIGALPWGFPHLWKPIAWPNSQGG
jgi:hypothetical protein